MNAALAVCRHELNAFLDNPGRLVSVAMVPMVLLLFTGLGIEAMLRERASMEGNFYQKWILSGVVVLGMLYCAYNVAMGVIAQQKSGQLGIMLLDCRRPWELLAGKIMAGLVECVAYGVVVGLFAPLLDVYPNRSEMLLGLLLVGVSALMIVAWVFCLASFSLHQEQFVMRSQTLTLLALTVGGMFFPITALRGPWLWLAWANPLTYAIDGLRGQVLAGEAFVPVAPLLSYQVDLQTVAGFALAGMILLAFRFPRWVGLR